MDLFKPPTADEIETLTRERGERGPCFSFSLKLTELLNATFVDSSVTTGTTPPPPPAALTSFLTGVHALILSLPSLPPVSAELALQRLAPYSLPLYKRTPPVKDPKWTLGWEKPSEIFVCGDWSSVGSYRVGKGKGKAPELNSIDLAIVMPDELFTAKDRQDNRYFYKRAHYMTVIASSVAKAINDSKSGQQKNKKDSSSKRKRGQDENTPSDSAQEIWKSVEVQWEWIDGDERRAGLVLNVPKNKALGLKHAYTIRLLPSISTELFAPLTMQPSKANLRASSSSDSTPSPTPLYNTSILKDTAYRPLLLYLHQHLQSCSSLRLALALWRIWGSRRGLPSLIGGVQEWNKLGVMIMGYTMSGGLDINGAQQKQGKIGSGLNEWQLLRASWEFLTSHDFANPAVFTLPSDASGPAIPPREFPKAFSRTFVDPSGAVNILAGLEEGDLDLIRHHARETSQMLARAGKSDTFESVFMTDLSNASVVFDEVFTVTLSADRSLEKSKSASDYASKVQQKAHEVAALLRQGLGSRVIIVSVHPLNPTCPWELTSSPTTRPLTLRIGLILNKSNAFGILDQGPPAEDTEGCKVFRQLWKNKAELRRFKDGSITESVVWSVDRPEERSLVPGMVVNYLLSTHFGLDEYEDEMSLGWLTPQYLDRTRIPASAHDMIYTEASAKQGFRPVLDSFDSLYKLIKSSDEELPLSVLNYSPMSPALRYTSTFIPYSIDSKRWTTAPGCLKWTPTIDVLLQFESSRKWPDDLMAIQKIKMAVLVKTAQVIEAASGDQDIQVAVVLDPLASDIEDSATLEVIMPNGHAFHLHIFLDRERTLLERIVEGSEPDTSERMKRQAHDALDLHIRRYTAAPRHHTAIVTLHHMHPSFASACRLLKRWVSAHLLSTHFPEEVLELFMAAVYLDPTALGAPATAHAGFLRSLHLIAHWAWREQALLVPLYTATQSHEKDSSTHNQTFKFPVEHREAAETGFQAARKADKDCHVMTMVIATEQDVTGRAWWRLGSPSRLVAARIQALAMATLNALQDGASVESLFVADLSGYDFALELSPTCTTRLAENALAYHDSVSRYWTEHVRNRTATGLADNQIKAGLDPVGAFVKDLERLYGKQAIFFYDAHGGSSIMGLWNPEVLQPRNFKPFLGYSTTPCEVTRAAGTTEASSSLVELNKQAILSEMQRLGEGMVDKVKVLKQ